MKVAICVTGGYYYNWPMGSHFYDWLHDFCSKNTQFVPQIMSWQPPQNVPERVKNQFGNNIHYRDNNGCDWGCYNHFVNYLKGNSLQEEYDYIIFCHDDIVSNYFDWPLEMSRYAQENNQFILSSFGSQAGYHELPEPEHVDSSGNTLGFYKSFDSMCFIARADENLFENNPFVTIPGFDQDECGDSGCTIVMYNILNTWGAESVGLAAWEGNALGHECLDYVGCFKRGRTVRAATITPPSPEKLYTSNIPRHMMETHQVIRQGWKFIPGRRAKNELLGIE